MAMSPAAMEEEQALKPNPGQLVPIYKRRKCRVWCLASLAVWISLAVVAIALSQTVFKFRHPEIALNDVKLQNVSLDFDLSSLSTILNFSISADVRVENLNYYDFKFSDSRMVVLYHGDQVGVGDLGAGTIRSRKTVDLPAVITVEALKLVLNALPDFASNVATLNVNSVLPGRVNVANVYKRHVIAVLNCTVDVFISNQTVKQNECKQSIKL